MLTLVCAFYAFGLLSITCEVCQRLNLAFEKCSDMFDQLDWYLFPNKIQRMLPIIFAFTQQPTEVKCFGSIACDRVSFKRVSIVK